MTNTTISTSATTDLGLLDTYAKQGGNAAVGACPSCGYCPRCGRSGGYGVAPRPGYVPTYPNWWYTPQPTVPTSPSWFVYTADWRSE